MQVKCSAFEALGFGTTSPRNGGERMLHVAKAMSMFVSLAFSAQAHADAYCAAVPSEVIVGSDGAMNVLTPSRGDFVGTCNLRSMWKGVDPQLCVTWFSLVSNAVLHRKALGYFYQGIGPGDCGSIATYERSPAPAYLRLVGQ